MNRTHAALNHLDSRDGQLVIGDRTVAQHVADAGTTPLYIYDRARIAARIAHLRTHLPAAVKLHYAVKANPHPSLLNFMAEHVDGFDIASSGELALARAAGANPATISIAGPGKSRRAGGDRQRNASPSKTLVGAAHPPGLLVIASREQVMMFDEQGHLVETLRTEHGLPLGIRAMGLRGNRMVLETFAGHYETDVVELQWRPVRTRVKPLTAAEPPAVLRNAIVQDARSREISRERVLRDLHSGSFFGAVGQWVVDIVALALLILSVTGGWLWLRKQREFGENKAPKARRRAHLAK